MAQFKRADYEKIFCDADKDGNGQLTFDELIGLLRSKGYPGSEAELKGYFQSVDKSGDGNLSMNEFLVAMGVIPPEKEETFMGVFRSFDKDGDGYIEGKELDAVFKEMGKHFHKAQIQRMMKMMDASGDGKVDYNEFKEHFC